MSAKITREDLIELDIVKVYLSLTILRKVVIAAYLQYQAVIDLVIHKITPIYGPSGDKKL